MTLDRLLKLEALATQGAPTDDSIWHTTEGAFREQLAIWFRANKSRLKEWEADAADPYGEQPTFFEMARTRNLRKCISDIVATHDQFVKDGTEVSALALKAMIDKSRSVGLTKEEQLRQEDYDCPHAYPHRYCESCRVKPCPLGLDRPRRPHD